MLAAVEEAEAAVVFQLVVEVEASDLGVQVVLISKLV